MTNFSFVSLTLLLSGASSL